MIRMKSRVKSLEERGHTHTQLRELGERVSSYPYPAPHVLKS